MTSRMSEPRSEAPNGGPPAERSAGSGQHSAGIEMTARELLAASHAQMTPEEIAKPTMTAHQHGRSIGLGSGAKHLVPCVR